MNASTSAGLLSARSRSGSVRFGTTSVSLQARKARARTLAATKRSLDIVTSSTEKGHARPPPAGPQARRGGPLLERRAHADREGAQVRERERIDRVDRGRTGAVQLRTTRQTDFGIEAAITREREQVT